MEREAGIARELTDELERGLHLHHQLSPRRERAMFAALGFVIALAITRGITTSLHYRGAGPNGGIVVRGVHIHHLVFGIVGLLLIGYGWLLLYGLEHEPRRWAFRLTGFAYGAASALVLDEFALWLNLKDVYWQHQGRESVEALAIFAGLLLWAVLIAPFARAALIASDIETSRTTHNRPLAPPSAAEAAHPLGWQSVGPARLPGGRRWRRRLDSPAEWQRLGRES